MNVDENDADPNFTIGRIREALKQAGTRPAVDILACIGSIIVAHRDAKEVISGRETKGFPSAAIPPQGGE